ncbi:MAG: ribosomal protein L7/L12 [Chloroflexota bacterium]
MEPATNRLLQLMIVSGALALLFITPIVRSYMFPAPEDVENDAPPPKRMKLDDALLDAELLDYMDERKKVHAIKRLRELTGAGLKEAKDTIDAFEREYHAG